MVSTDTGSLPLTGMSCSSQGKKGDKTGSEASLLNSINQEIFALCTYLEHHQVSGAEMQRMLQPFVTAVEGPKPPPAAPATPPPPPQRRRCIETALIACFVLAIMGYGLAQVLPLSKFMLMSCRHIQLVLLPYWDWSRLYYADCLVTNPFYVRQALSHADCNVCESLESLDVLTELPVSVATDEYLRDDRPFVVTDAMADWAVMNTDDFWFDNITELYRSSDLTDVYPCELTTNLRIPPDDLQRFLRRIHLPAVDRWYGHWENCNKKAAKALRSFYQRPYFMPHMVDFSDTNWVLMSSDYKAKVYKEVAFQSEVLWLGAVRGWWHLRVVPLEPCNQHCPELTVTITEGHMLVVTNRLWKLEYIPGEETDNLAIAVGGFWN